MGQERRAMLQMLLCGILWSFGGILIKLVPWNALVIAGVRSALTAVVMLAYMRKSNMRILVTKRTLAIGIATFLLVALFLSANKLTTAANAIVLQYTAPIYVLIFSAVFQHAKVRRGDVVALMITMVGIGLFFLDQLGTGSVLGDSLALVSGVFFGLMFFLSGGVTEETRMSGLFLGQIMTAIVGIPLAFVYDTPITTTAVVCIVILGVFQLGIPYILYSKAVKHCSPLMCSIISVVEPLLNPVWVFLAMGELPSSWALVGGVIVLVTITLWCVWSAKEKQKAAALEEPAVAGQNVSQV